MTVNNLNILHIEDNSFDADITEQLLKDACGENIVNLSHVKTLKDALYNLNQNKYNLVLLNLMLQDVSGIKTITAIKNQCPDIAIIVLSGIEGYEIALRAFQAGAQKFIVKAYENSNVLKYAIYSAIERKKFEDKIYKEANYDPITGLPSFRSLHNRLKLDITRSKSWKKNLALMAVEIADFDLIRETYGVATCNHAIKILSKKIRSVTKNSDYLARYMDDELAVILDLDDEPMKTACAQLAGKVMNELKKPFKVGGKNIKMSVNIGFSFYPSHGPTADDMLESVDMAVARSREVGPNVYKFA